VKLASYREKIKAIARRFRIPAFLQGLRTRFRLTPDGWQEGISLILLFITLEIAVRSIEQAGWLTPQPSFTLVLVIAVLTALVLAKSRLRNAVRYAVVIILGILMIFWQSAVVLSFSPGVPGDNLVQSWWRVLTTTRPSESTLPFAIFIAAVVWVTGYVSTWYVLRRRNGWVAVGLGALMALVNLSNLNRSDYIFLFFYLIAAALLVGQLNWTRYFHYFPGDSTGQVRRGAFYFMASVLCLSIVATSVAWYTPEIHADRLETLISSNMPKGENIEEYWANIFAAVPRKQRFLRSDEQDELSFGTFFDIGEEVQFTINSSQPHYWRLRAYDVYNSTDWTNSPSAGQVLKRGAASPSAAIFPESSKITYSVIPRIWSDILLVAGEFISSDALEVNRIQVAGEDTVSVTARLPLRPEERYTVTSSISLYTAGDLSRAGDSYPSWVTSRYLQLPSALPERVKRLSARITANARSPYEKALAINSYLAGLTYSLDIKPPPAGTDAVDYFLYTQKSGNCAYFASAMAVMLRSAGVPARFSVGYLPGEQDKASGNQLLRAKQFHAWPEAYFPGLGWIEVEKVPVPIISDTGEELGTPDYASYFEDDWSYLLDTGGGGANNGDVPSMAINFPVWFWPTVLSIFVTAVVVLLVWWISMSAFQRWLWRMKGPDPITGIYARICFLASLIGLGPLPHQTPLEYGTRLTAAFPHEYEPIDYMVRTYQESRFGGRKKPGLADDAMFLKYRTDLYQLLMGKAGPIKYLFHKR